MLANLVYHPLSIFVMESVLSFVILLKIKSTFFSHFVCFKPSPYSFLSQDCLMILILGPIYTGEHTHH